MASLDKGQRVIRFGAFELDVQSGELRKQGLKTRLPHQSFQVLLLLLAHPGDVVTREQLRQELWPADTFVDFDMGVSSAVKKLRDALGDTADSPRFVETLPRRGYRFIAAVEPEPIPASPPVEIPDPVSAPVRPRRRFPRLMAGAMAAVVVAAGFALSGMAHSWRRPSPPQIRSLAVLPFQNLTGDHDQDYFVDGMTEALTTDLAQIAALKVISRTSAMQYKGAGKSLPAIADELGVDAVVEGAVTRSGGRVRVTAQLIEAATDRHLWARSYDRELRDVLILQGEVAKAIAQAIQIQLRPEEQQRLSRTATVRPEAYEAYLKGRFYWSLRGRENLLRAAGYFQQAIAADPTYAPAYSGLSDAYRQSDQQGMAPRVCMPKAEAAARKALELDETLAEAHASLAGVLYRYQWDWDGAKREFERALELDPNYAEGHRAYAIYLLTTRRDEQALAEAQRAQELNPLSSIISVELATALTRVGRYDDAIERLRKTRELEPAGGRVNQTLALVYLAQGDLQKAIDVFEKARADQRRTTAAPGPWLGYLYGATGHRAEALAALRALEQRSHEQYVPPQQLAIVQVGLGNPQQAFTLLEKAYEEREIEVLGFSGPLFDLLHDDPRYRKLVDRMGLTDAYFPARRAEAPARSARAAR
jgi:TolB-like protein/DNA-binding winged helix-turn-helix (wHTH) protein/Flp pilus assembly protein TadD